MKIIRQGHVDPDFLSNLDKKNNIVMCVHPLEEDTIKELSEFPDTFGIFLPRDLNLSTSDIIKISSSALSTTHRLKLKISIPAGLKIQFCEYMKDRSSDIFWKNYRSFELYNVHDSDNNLSHHIISDIIFIMYMDTIRMREAGLRMLINKGTQISEFYFTWYVQTKNAMPQIEEIYLISDSHVYEDFINIF